MEHEQRKSMHLHSFKLKKNNIKGYGLTNTKDCFKIWKKNFNTTQIKPQFVKKGALLAESINSNKIYWPVKNKYDKLNILKRKCAPKKPQKNVLKKPQIEDDVDLIKVLENYLDEIGETYDKFANFERKTDEISIDLSSTNVMQPFLDFDKKFGDFFGF